MKRYSIVIFILLLLEDNISAAPANHMEMDPELSPGYMEGDMILPPEQRNGLREDTYRWPDQTVFYYINSNIDQAHRNHIYVAIQTLELNSCLIFKEVSTDQPYYVNITAESGGCYTVVGYQNRVQQLNLENYALDTGCYRLGTIMHEFLHALGFYHQQSTWNRDDYIRVVEENIIEGKEHNFRKYDKDRVENFDQDYDYASVLHYTPYGFSKNGEATIVSLQEGGEKLMGQRLQLTEADINKLNIMYKCPRHT